MKTSRQTHSRRRGQATAEVVIGLVGITVVFFGLIQIAQLGHNSIANLYDARGQADLRAAGQMMSGPENDYVADWGAGPDALPFTADDTPVAGVNTLGPYTVQLEQPPTISDMMAGYGLGDRDSFGGFLQADSIALAADLRKGTKSRSLAVEPVLRKLLLGKTTSLYLSDRVYMPYLQLLPEGTD